MHTKKTHTHTHLNTCAFIMDGLLQQQKWPPGGRSQMVTTAPFRTRLQRNRLKTNRGRLWNRLNADAFATTVGGVDDRKENYEIKKK